MRSRSPDGTGGLRVRVEVVEDILARSTVADAVAYVPATIWFRYDEGCAYDAARIWFHSDEVRSDFPASLWPHSNQVGASAVTAIPARRIRPSRP